MGMERIQAYHVGFYLCLGIAVVGGVLAVLFFFTLQIKEAWRMSFGRRIYTKEKGKGETKNAKEATDVIVCSHDDGQSNIGKGRDRTDGNGRRAGRTDGRGNRDC